MARTFRDTLDTDAESTFLNVDEFAVSIEHRREGRATETIVGILDVDDMAGPQPTADGGTRIQQAGKLEILASVEVAEEQAGGRYPSLFAIGGVWWVARQVLAKDDAMQTVFVMRTDQKSTKRASS